MAGGAVLLKSLCAGQICLLSLTMWRPAKSGKEAEHKKGFVTLDTHERFLSILATRRIQFIRLRPEIMARTRFSPCTALMTATARTWMPTSTSVTVARLS